MYRLSYAGFVTIAVLLYVFGAGKGLVCSHGSFDVEGVGQRLIFTESAKPNQVIIVTTENNTQRTPVCYSSIDPREIAAKVTPYYGKMIISCVSFSTLTSPLDYAIEPFIELCITDPLNKRTGYNNSTQTVIKEIPEGFYHEDGLTSADPKYPRGPVSKTIVIESPSEGNYTLQVIGTHTGGYEINISILDQNLNVRNIFEKIRRITSPGTIHSYEICFYRDDVNKFTITKKVTPRELQGSLQTAFKLTWMDDKRILNDLVTKIESADSECKQGNNDSAINILQSFIKDVEARKGRHIAGTAADILIDDAKSLIRQLQK